MRCPQSYQNLKFRHMIYQVHAIFCNKLSVQFQIIGTEVFEFQSQAFSLECQVIESEVLVFDFEGQVIGCEVLVFEFEGQRFSLSAKCSSLRSRYSIL